MSPLVARLDGLAADVHRLACRLLGPDALAALHEGSAAGAPINPRIVASWEASQAATEALRRLGAAAGLDAAQVAAIGADHYGRRPAAAPTLAPSSNTTATATETDHA